jgi:predicted ribosome quality control (RQC) complex YloA/Tae2 family protein
MKFREFVLSTGTNILLGKNAENNDELVKNFRGKENLILHTIAPGSPFCVIDSENPTREEIKESAIICAAKSQDWRDNKKDVELHLFSGKNVKKPVLAKTGTWKLTSKPKVIKVKKKEIEEWIKKQ